MKYEPPTLKSREGIITVVRAPCCNQKRDPEKIVWTGGNTYACSGCLEMSLLRGDITREQLLIAQGAPIDIVNQGRQKDQRNFKLGKGGI